jgi:hypothetical protein
MRNLEMILTLGRGKAAALIVFTLAAGSLSLRADMVCMGDCEQPTASHLSGISGSEDVEDGISGFDIFFKPGVPIFLIGPSSMAGELNSSGDFASSKLAAADPFLGGGDWTGVPLEGSSPGSGSGFSDPSLVTLLNNLAHSSGPGDIAPPAPDPPAPTPEPRYSGLAMLGLGGAVLALFRRLRPSRAA